MFAGLLNHFLILGKHKDGNQNTIIVDNTVRKILVAIDGSERSLKVADYAISQARKENAELVILSIIEIEPWYHGKFPYEWGTMEKLDQVYANDKTKRQNILDIIKEKAEKSGVHASTNIIMALITVSKSATISDYAKNKQVDLIVVGTKTRSSFAKFFLGDAKVNTYNQANCPVLIVK